MSTLKEFKINYDSLKMLSTQHLVKMSETATDPKLLQEVRMEIQLRPKVLQEPQKRC